MKFLAKLLAPFALLLAGSAYAASPVTITGPDGSQVAVSGGALNVNATVSGNTGYNQGSTTSGQQGPLVQCAATTSAPTYTTATTNPLSCDPSGALRITAPPASPISVTVNAPPNDTLTGPTNVTGATDVVVNGQGNGSASLQITGTFTGLSGVMQASDDGTNYVTAVSTGTAVVSLNSSAGALDPPSSVSSNGKNVSATNFPNSVDTNTGTSGANTLRVAQGSGPWTTTETPATSGGLSTYVVQPAASDNHAVVKNGAGQVYHIYVMNNSATINYFRLYNAGTGFNGCNSASNLVWQGIIPANSTNGAGFVEPIPEGLAFSTGISVCITGAYGNTDTTNATATAITFNLGYK